MFVTFGRIVKRDRFTIEGSAHCFRGATNLPVNKDGREDRPASHGYVELPAPGAPKRRRLKNGTRRVVFK
jgi:hypothetical protein